ncbi:MAG: CDP-glycerol glycerophosphotransferase family protein [Colwellia sp.]|nr:CDP-glycerol glycerophosphotransferase family protein [Colwellia sp.]
MNVFFDIQHLYYLPQYIPVKDALEKNSVRCHFILYNQNQLQKVLINYVENEKLNYTLVNDSSEAKALYLDKKPHWIIFGNAFHDLEKIHQSSKTAMMNHGVGPKSCYYDWSDCDIQHRFVEGQHRLKRLMERFPSKKFIDTGYAKLDPIVNNENSYLDLEKLGLDPKKETVLYAPTYYPSSIECLPDNFPESLAKYNLIIKPHYFSLIKDKYKNHQKIFKSWSQYSNVYIPSVEETSIIPFMSTASLLISDASSTLFEFTALNKPAIWCDFFKVRWSYRGIFKWRLNKRLDDDLKYFTKVAQQVVNTKELVQQVDTQINNPQLKEKDRLELTELLIGKVDGNCSKRITEYLLNHTE